MGRHLDRYVRRGTARHPRPSATCPTCGEVLYAANNADASAALAKHLGRHRAKARGGAK